jgi:redox-sensitive bicupin YhaK (pirin superfamily)
MSNLDVRPDPTPCESAAASGAVTEIYPSREVPLGGIRAITVRRALPQRDLPTVGAWCFLDQFGPQRAEMGVLPHPHTGLQTVTWPLAGEIRHRDSVGSDVVIKPGQLNLMTSGPGIAHSEFSVGRVPLLHGLQLWVALPTTTTGIRPAFEQHTDLPVHEQPGLRATVLIGELGSAASPATAHTPLVGAEISVDAEADIPLRPEFEYAVLVIDGEFQVGDAAVPPGPLIYLGTGRDEIRLSGKARAILLGGEPFAERLVMWWNFVGRSHEAIAAARAEWEHPEQTRFGTVDGHGTDRIPAPPMPDVRLTPRKRQR